MFGLLNLDKPRGATSRDVVNRIQRLAGRAKVGHAGTLDPLATGVLVVCVGPATRLIEYIQRMPKRYHGTFLLGRKSDTEDIEGEVQQLPDAPQPTEEQLRVALPRFVGEIEQVPPAYSALKVQGRRAYKLARAGKSVDLKPRTIIVHELLLLRYVYPEFELAIACGSGTYVRSLGRDIAKALGTEAVMSALIRTAIGDFRVEDALDVESLTSDNLASKLLSPLKGLTNLPHITLDENERRRLSQGLAIEDRWTVGAEELAAIDSAGRLCSILSAAAGRQLRPNRNFPID